jgi:hypothetical protein
MAYIIGKTRSRPESPIGALYGRAVKGDALALLALEEFFGEGGELPRTAQKRRIEKAEKPRPRISEDGERAAFLAELTRARGNTWAAR